MRRYIFGLLGAACAWLGGVPTQAGIIFDNNPITFTPPSIISGVGTITSTTPTLVELSNGLELLDLSSTVTAGSTAQITVEFSADRSFLADVDPFVQGRLSGFTTVTQSGGTSQVIVQGITDNIPRVTFISPMFMGPGTFSVPIEAVGFVYFLPPGRHTHRWDGRYTFTPGKPGDTITVSSDYEFTLSVVPEPTSLTLLGVGLFGVLSYAMVRSRCYTANLQV
jgi:hypothetical protein